VGGPKKPLMKITPMSEDEPCYIVAWPAGFPHFVEKGRGTPRLTVVIGANKTKAVVADREKMLAAICRRHTDPEEAKATFETLAKGQSKDGPHAHRESEWGLLEYFGDMYIGAAVASQR
jgi:hypothetical protein